MKKLLAILIAVSMGLALTLVTPQSLEAKKKKKSVASKTSFYQVVSQLDQGGSYYMYMSSEKLIKGIEKFMATLEEMALLENSEKPKEQAQIKKGFGIISDLLHASGLFEISGVGMSSIELGNGFIRSRTVVHHYKGKGNGLIWKIDTGSPHPLESQKLLPADTVFARFSDTNTAYFWNWLKERAAQSGIPELQDTVGKIGPMLMQKGIDLEGLIDSLGTRAGFIVTLDSSKMCKFPAKGGALEFPDPALAMVFFVKNDSVFKLLQKFTPTPPQQNGSVRKIVGPVVPLPITLNPMLVQADNLLILASNGKIVDDILAARKGGKSLLASAEFNKLSQGLPKAGNAYTFLSSRVGKTLFGLLEEAMIRQPDGAKASAVLERLNLLPKDVAIYSVKQSTSEGFIFTSNHNLPVTGTTIMPAIAVTGIVAAIVIPNILTAKAKGKQKATMGDMRAIATAIEAYRTDNGHLPKGSSLAEIRDRLEPTYIKRLPMKDAWDNDFLYNAPGKDSYRIGAACKDGYFAGWEQDGCYKTATVDDFNKDIILVDGEFTFCPN